MCLRYILLLLLFFIGSYSGAILAATGGHIGWSGSVSGNNGTGKGAVRIGVPSQTTSSAIISVNNVWVSETPDEYTFDSQCLSWGGSVKIYASYRVKDKNYSENRVHNFSAYFMFANAHLIADSIDKAMTAVSINQVDSSGLYLMNKCAQAKYVNIFREMKVGENKWDLRISGYVPFKSQCSLSVASSVDVGDISYSDLRNSDSRLLQKNKKSVPISWDCQGNDIRTKITVSANKWSQQCLASDNNSLRFCVFQKDGVTPVDLTSGQSSFDVTEDKGTTELVIIPGWQPAKTRKESGNYVSKNRASVR